MSTLTTEELEDRLRAVLHDAADVVADDDDVVVPLEARRRLAVRPLLVAAAVIVSLALAAAVLSARGDERLTTGPPPDHRTTFGRWVPTAPPLRGRVDGALAVAAGKRVVVFGGQSVDEAGAARSDAEAWDPEADTWRAYTSGPVAWTRWTVAVWTGKEVVVVNDSGSAALDPDSGRWRSLPAPPSSMGSGIVGWTGREVGVASFGLESTQVVLLDPVGGTWRSRSLPPRAEAAAAWDGPRLYAAGGWRVFAECTAHDDMLVVDVETGTTTTHALPGDAGQGGALAVDGSRVIWGGGWVPRKNGQGCGGPQRVGTKAFDTGSGTWSDLPETSVDGFVTPGGTPPLYADGARLATVSWSRGVEVLRSGRWTPIPGGSTSMLTTAVWTPGGLFVAGVQPAIVDPDVAVDGPRFCSYAEQAAGGPRFAVDEDGARRLAGAVRESLLSLQTPLGLCVDQSAYAARGGSFSFQPCGSHDEALVADEKALERTADNGWKLTVALLCTQDHNQAYRELEVTAQLGPATSSDKVGGLRVLDIVSSG
jgi:hypothetical protein